MARHEFDEDKSYYTILGIDRYASDAEIKRAYRKQAMLHHPDMGTGNPDKLIEINRAYEVLSNKGLRARYDSERARRGAYDFASSYRSTSGQRGQGQPDDNFDIVIDVPSQLQALVRDIVQGFEDYTRVQGYELRVSVASFFSDNMVIRVALPPNSPNVASHTIGKDFQSYINVLESHKLLTYTDTPKQSSAQDTERLLSGANDRLSVLLFLLGHDKQDTQILDMARGVGKQLESGRIQYTTKNVGVFIGVRQYLGGRHTSSTSTVKVNIEQLDNLLQLLRATDVPDTSRKRNAIEYLEVASREAKKSKPSNRKIKKSLQKAGRYLVAFGQVSAAVSDITSFYTALGLDKYIHYLL